MLDAKQALKTFIMSAILNKFNKALQSKKYITWTQCEVGDYQTSSFKLVKTKHGDRVRVEFGDFASFLPMQEEFTKEEVAALNKERPILSYKGKVDGKQLVQLIVKPE